MLLNKVQLVTFPHVVLSAYLTGTAFVVGIALWHLYRADSQPDHAIYRSALRTGAAVVLVAGIVPSGYAIGARRRS